MKDNYELIEYVHKDANMGVYTIEKVLETLKERDNKITGLLEETLEEYRDFVQSSRRKLEENNIKPDEESFLSKMWSNMEITKEIKKDNSDASIADIMIKGISSGHIEIEKRLIVEKEEDDALDEHKKIAKKYEKFQKKTMEKFKKYL